MTSDIVARAARAAAKELASEYGPPLEAEVEAVIYSAGDGQPPTQFTDWNAVAQTIVQVATLAWMVYQAVKKPGEKPSQETVARKVRVEYRKETDLTTGAEKIIEVVTREITEYGDRGELE